MRLFVLLDLTKTFKLHHTLFSIVDNIPTRTHEVYNDQHHTRKQKDNIR